MARKEYSPDITELEILKKINTRLHSHCSVYTIDNEMVYMMSHRPFYEKFAVLNPENRLYAYNNTLISAPSIRGFLAKYRKTKTTVFWDKKNNVVHLTAEDDNPPPVDITLIPDDIDVRTNVNIQMYSKYLKDSSVTDAIQNPTGENYLVSEDDMEHLRQNRTIRIETKSGTFAYIAKGILGDIKHVVQVRYRELESLCVPELNKHYLLIEQTEDIGILIYTLIACIC